MVRPLLKGWRKGKFGNELTAIVGGGTPDRRVAEYWQGEIPWATVKDLNNGHVSGTQERISEEGLKRSASNLIPAGTVIIATRMAVGRVVRFPMDVAINQDLKALFPKSTINTGFLALWLASREQFLGSQSSGSTVAGIRLEALHELPILLPPLPEQEKIAEILGSVDAAITATRRVIEQTRTLKHALMQELLTKGVPGRHMHFKDSPLGPIPEEWEVATLEELLGKVDTPIGSALKKADLATVGIPFLGIDNVHREKFVLSYKRFVPPAAAKELRRFLVRPLDLIITIMGTVGRCCVVPDNVGKALSSKHIWTITFDRGRYIPALACWQINYAPWVLQHFSASGQGAVMDSISSSVLRSTLLPVPPMAEQVQIDNIREALSRRETAEGNHLQALEASRLALLQPLLVGDIRVSLPKSHSIKEAVHG